ncbi:MAG: hypothetical protein JW943_08925 [Deltaproteobacteria bacterium]|nr:hypothetical protein [Deltaproteobacteria bacterium]
MKSISDDSESQAFSSTIYMIRGRMFRKNSFDIIDSSGKIVLLAKPPAMISNGISIYSIEGEELIACRSKSSLKDAYISDVFRYEAKDCVTTRIMGGLMGLKSNSPEGVEWQIVDPQKTQIGRITQEATQPEVRYGGKPIYDMMTGLIGDEKAFVFKVDINSFRFKMSADFSMDSRGALDRRLGLALVVLFSSMKRTQSDDT